PVGEREGGRGRIAVDRHHVEPPSLSRPQETELLAPGAEDEQLGRDLHPGIVAGALDGARDVVYEGYTAWYAGCGASASRRDGIASAASAPTPTMTAPTHTAGCMPSTKCCGRP